MKDLLFQDKLLFRWVITAKPPGNWLKNRRLCLSAPTICLPQAIVGLSNRRRTPRKRPGPTPLSYTRASRLGTNWVIPSDGVKRTLVQRQSDTFKIQRWRRVAINKPGLKRIQRIRTGVAGEIDSTRNGAGDVIVTHELDGQSDRGLIVAPSVRVDRFD